jgi:hypothetical protein
MKNWLKYIKENAPEFTKGWLDDDKLFKTWEKEIEEYYKNESEEEIKLWIKIRLQELER